MLVLSLCLCVFGQINEFGFDFLALKGYVIYIYKSSICLKRLIYQMLLDVVKFSYFRSHISTTFG